jgi:hypothetical protein
MGAFEGQHKANFWLISAGGIYTSSAKDFIDPVWNTSGMYTMRLSNRVYRNLTNMYVQRFIIE